MTINLHVPPKGEPLRPNITVVGVGGAGGNAVNNMIKANLEGVNFVVANTDAQAIEHALTDRRIQLGVGVTQGLGAGAMPEVGAEAAEEALEEIESHIHGSNMLFITAGMGGGTGTGAAPVVARLARDMNILTVAVVTKPFHFEGTHRMRTAEEGLKELQKYVDTLIVIPNQNLFRIANEKTTFADAFSLADEVLHSGVRGVTDLMVMPGLINLDFADIRAVMREMGKAMMGTGEAEGERRAVEAAEAAISNPLLDDVSMKGARGVLINITGGSDLTLFEVDEAANRIREEVDPEANIIFGAIFNDQLDGRIRVSVVATGVDSEQMMQPHPANQYKSEPRQTVAGRAKVAVGVRSGAFAMSGMDKPANEQPEQLEAEIETVSEVAPEPSKKKDDAAASKVTGFIPPKPVEPNRPQDKPSPSLRSASYQQRADDSAASEPRMDDAQSGNLWQRVGKAFSMRIDDQEAEQQMRRRGNDDKPTVESAPMAQKSDEDANDYLDIPAFLRRQAN